MVGSLGKSRTMVSRTTIILNAKKPREPAERARELLTEQGVRVHIEVTEHARAGREAAERAIQQGAQCIIAAGGDGTVLSVLEPVVRSGTTLGLLPLGTANDFATYLGLSTVDHALHAFATGELGLLDVGEVNYLDSQGASQTGLFCSSAGIGVMGHLAELEEARISRVLKRVLGNGVWPLLALSATLGARFSRARITVDGTSMERDIAALEVTKLPRVGGIEVTPDASADSGILHAWIAEGTTRRELIHTLRHALAGDGKLLESRYLQYFSTDPARNVLGKSHVQRIEVQADLPLPVHLNGDHVGTTPASFQVLSAALRITLPAGHLHMRPPAVFRRRTPTDGATL